MRGAQGPMPQNRSKPDTLAKERTAHEECERKDSYGGSKPATPPMPQRGGDSDREGGY